MISTINISVAGAFNKQNGSQKYIRTLFFVGFVIVLCACFFATTNLETVSINRRLGSIFHVKNAQDAWNEEESEYMQLLGPDMEISDANKIGFRFVTRNARAHLAPTSLVAPSLVGSGMRTFMAQTRREGEISDMAHAWDVFKRDFKGSNAVQNEIFYFKLHSSGKILVKIQTKDEMNHNDKDTTFGVLTAIGAPDTTGNNAGAMARVKFCLSSWSANPLGFNKVCDRWIYYNKPLSTSQYRDIPGIEDLRNQNIEVKPTNTLKLLMQGLFETNKEHVEDTGNGLPLKVTDPKSYNDFTGVDVKGTPSRLFSQAKRQWKQRAFAIKHQNDCIDMSKGPSFDNLESYFKFELINTHRKEQLTHLD